MEKLENVNWRSYDKRYAQRRIFKFWCRAPKRSRSHTGFENRIFKNEKKKSWHTTILNLMKLVVSSPKRYKTLWKKGEIAP